MEIGTTLRISSETQEKDIAGFSEMKVQPFFRSRAFPNLNHKNLSKILEKEKIKILSLHYPSLQNDFLENLKMLKESYNCNIFTVHPWGETSSDFIQYLRIRENPLSDLNVQLALENMPFEYSWTNDLNAIYKITKEFPFVSLTYDITHLPKSLGTIETIVNKLDRVSIVHLSNVIYGLKKKDHQPIDKGERNIYELLQFLKQNQFKGQIILEYNIHDPIFYKKEVEKVNFRLNL
jgi:sugar phosphate isomerase/epimerase